MINNKIQDMRYFFKIQFFMYNCQTSTEDYDSTESIDETMPNVKRSYFKGDTSYRSSIECNPSLFGPRTRKASITIQDPWEPLNLDEKIDDPTYWESFTVWIDKNKKLVKPKPITPKKQ